MASGSQELSYATDENKAGFVRVILPVKGLKVSKKMVGILKWEKVADNATIDLSCSNRGFDVSINGTKDLKEKRYHLKIQQLPGDIVSDDSYFEAEKDRVLLFLCKQSSESWYPELSDGLETME